MSEYIFGAHILEILTTGMYQDSRMIFREYIQNSCDSIDKAEKYGVLEPEEGRIEIEIDPDRRNITITDNGTGIKANDFVRTMGSIADSQKTAGYDKGFRGIGRLCGLAYCTSMVFTSKFQGENVISKLVCNAEFMRQLIGEDAVKRCSAQEVLEAVNEFSQEKTEDTDAHYFRVELIAVNANNKVLCNIENVNQYLSFTAPLPYSVTFAAFRSQIYDHAKELGLRIDEYDIRMNGEQLFKEYTPRFKAGRGQGEDEIFDLIFEDFRDKDNNLIAWLWFGISRFKGMVDNKCPMAGIRLRKENIQIGNADTLNKFFREPRGNYYFIGELFCVSKSLIPNSQRNYFNENYARSELEEILNDYCENVLHEIYKGASSARSLIKKIGELKKKNSELNDRIKKGLYIDDEHRKQIQNDIHKTKDELKKTKDDIAKLKAKSEIIHQIVEHIEDRTDTASENVSTTEKYTQKELAIIRKIFGVISDNLGKELADTLIQKIQERLK